MDEALPFEIDALLWGHTYDCILQWQIMLTMYGLNSIRVWEHGKWVLVGESSYEAPYSIQRFVSEPRRLAMVRPRYANPTPGELEVLQVIWDRGPSTVREVMEVLNQERPRAYTSVMRPCHFRLSPAGRATAQPARGSSTLPWRSAVVRSQAWTDGNIANS